MYKILIVIALFISINANAQNKVQRFEISPNYVEKVIEHTVEAGQNLYRLSKMYGVKVEKIIERNGLPSETIQLDDKIYFYFEDIKASMSENLVYGAPIYHTVEPKESLFNIARRQYGITMDELRSWNNLYDNDELSIGQDLIIGWIPNMILPVAGEVITSVPNTSATVTTTIETSEVITQPTISESLETVSTESAMSTETSKVIVYDNTPSTFEWSKRTAPLKTDVQSTGLNAGNSFPIYNEAGEVATVGEVVNPTPSYSSRSVVSKPEIAAVGTTTVISERSTEEISTTEIEETTKPVFSPVEKEAVYSEPVSDVTLPRSNRAQFMDVRSNPGAKTLQEEKGMAKVLDTNLGSMGSYYCLHANAPKGTILRVQNPVNNYTIYVEVLGKLPNTGDNEKAMLKLSKNSVEALNALDHQFLVECEYYN